MNFFMMKPMYSVSCNPISWTLRKPQTLFAENVCDLFRIIADANPLERLASKWFLVGANFGTIPPERFTAR
jgi:hypothetical protein